MDDLVLERILAAGGDAALQALVEAHALDMGSVQALKAHSAGFYYERPAEAVRIAKAACCLACLLPPPAPVLGRWTLANALLFADRYQEAAGYFEQARTNYLAMNNRLDAARMGVGYIWALAHIGQFERALELAGEIEPVLTAWVTLPAPSTAWMKKRVVMSAGKRPRHLCASGSKCSSMLFQPVSPSEV